ncbi:hypothetical protein GCM10023190_26540 [Enteractinococcus fodinae]|uniref:Uncharacterized protein n=1 Tax=Enteractinococcus fodinae TaxID=684663 RepID=A0ABU2B1W9_9MICC|nr:hypothetical protein [Enteractinococcus fodinae]MDR7347586.1 hypothetical protein [Enteractinococcus fodinae]
MSNYPTPEQLRAFNPPPPPPADWSAHEQDVGLATEMVFSGQQRQQLREAAAYERLSTDEVQYQRYTPQDHQTDQSDERFAMTTLLLYSLIGVGVFAILAILISQVFLGG